MKIGKKPAKGFVKITSGLFRGQKITTPGGNTHPMGEREKIALFNMINDSLPGSKVLDAFSGSGALGLETLSRGASSVVFIDNNQVSYETIKDNIKKLSIPDAQAKVIRGDVYQVLTTLDNIFDIVIADPPYDQYDTEKLTSLSSVLSRPGGVLVLSHPGDAPDLPHLKLLKTRQYAAAHISIYTTD